MSIAEIETPRAPARGHAHTPSARGACMREATNHRLERIDTPEQQNTAAPHWRELAANCYSRITPMQAVDLWEKKSGEKILILRQQDGKAGMYTPELGIPRWLHLYMAQNFDAVFAAISEERGRHYIRPGGEFADIVRCHLSPWDEQIEAAIAASDPGHRAGRLRAQGRLLPASLQSMWRHILMLGEITADKPTDDWRYDRMRRQMRDLAEAISRRKPKSLRDLRVQLDFIASHFDHRAHPLASRALKAAASGLNSVTSQTHSIHQEALRHAA